MTKISQLADIGPDLAAGDEFVIRDVSDATTPNKKVTASGFMNYVIGQGAAGTFSTISAGVGSLARVQTSASGATGTITFATAPAGTIAECARFDPDGKFLINTTSALTNVQLGGPAFTPRVQIQGSDINSSTVSLTRTTAFPPYFVFNAGSNGNNVANNTTVGSVVFNGFDGTNYVTAGSIFTAIDGTPGTNSMPGRLMFSTTASGTNLTTERMRISADGKTAMYSSGEGLWVLVSASGGTTIPLIRGYNLATSTTGAGGNPFIVWSNGNVVNLNNSYGAISDIKLKENIVDASSQWDDIKALQVRNYNLKEGQTHTQIGLVAQEVELVSPGLVTESPDRDAEGNEIGTVTKSVNYSVLYMKAVKALQEAMERIETLEAKVASLEGA